MTLVLISCSGILGFEAMTWCRLVTDQMTFESKWIPGIRAIMSVQAHLIGRTAGNEKGVVLIMRYIMPQIMENR